MSKDDKGKVLVCPRCKGTIIMYVGYKEAWCTKCKDKKGNPLSLEEVTR